MNPRIKRALMSSLCLRLALGAVLILCLWILLRPPDDGLTATTPLSSAVSAVSVSNASVPNESAPTPTFTVLERRSGSPSSHCASVSLVVIGKFSKDFMLPCLTRLLRSVEYQTVSPCEVLLVISSTGDADSGAQQSLNQLWLQWVDRLQHSRLVFFLRHDEHLQADNRNFGTRHATEEVVSFLDNDDMLYPQKIEIVQQLFRDLRVDGLLHTWTDTSHSNQRRRVEDLMYNLTGIEPPYGLVEPVNSTAIRDEYVRMWRSEGSKPDWMAFGYHKARVHNAHGTFRRDVLLQCPQREDREYFRKEDSKHNSDLYLKGYNVVMSSLPLTFYEQPACNTLKSRGRQRMCCWPQVR